MQSLLGKITKITRIEVLSNSQTSFASAPVHLEVRLKPVCVLPQRTQVPEWLKDQTLTVQRSVGDEREVGRPGDSIVLCPDEASPLLYPLQVEPQVSYGSLPKTLHLKLRWWKDDKPPAYNVRAGGRVQTGEFQKEGEVYAATIETQSFFRFRTASAHHF